MRRRLLAVLLALAACAPAFGAKNHVGDEPTPEWREGPVRYIITKSEDDEFKDLRTQSDRAVFIENFWRRRDPTPETPGNEYRSAFWRRVHQADSQFGKDNPRPGWRSDMGKIFILLGPADDIKRDDMAEGRRGIVVWTYRNSPKIGEISTLAGPNTVIAFAQDDSGEYRMTAEPTKLANVWQGLPDPQPPFGPFQALQIQRKALMEAYSRQIGLTDPVIREAGGPAIESPLGLTMMLGRLQQPPKEWTLRGEVNTRQFFGPLPFRARADFFKTTGRETQVLFNIALKSTAVTFRETPAGGRPSVRVYARIFDATAAGIVQALDHDYDFAPSPGNETAGLDDDLVYQARALMAPGSYVARITVVDDVSGRSGNSDSAFSVPDFTAPSLELSSVTLARLVETAPADPASTFVPFVLGTMRIVPRLSQDFAQSDDLAIYYQVYGAKTDSATGLPRLNVAYVFMAPDGKSLSEIGRVVFDNQTTEAHGYSLPLKSWPAGEYLLRVEVTDAVSTTKVTRDLVFRIAAKS